MKDWTVYRERCRTLFGFSSQRFDLAGAAVSPGEPEGESLYINGTQTGSASGLYAVDGNGNINWDPQFPLPNGTYEFYLASQDAWHTSTNINDLNKMDQLYGKMIMTIGDDKDECEFYLDYEMLAEKLHCDPSDFKLVEAQFGRIGQQWITTAGSSSGALRGIGLSVAVVGGVLFWRRKRSRTAEAVAE